MYILKNHLSNTKVSSEISIQIQIRGIRCNRELANVASIDWVNWSRNTTKPVISVKTSNNGLIKHSLNCKIANGTIYKLPTTCGTGTIYLKSDCNRILASGDIDLFDLSISLVEENNEQKSMSLWLSNEVQIFYDISIEKRRSCSDIDRRKWPETSDKGWKFPRKLGSFKNQDKNCSTEESNGAKRNSSLDSIPWFHQQPVKDETTNLAEMQNQIDSERLYYEHPVKEEESKSITVHNVYNVEDKIIDSKSLIVSDLST